MNIKQIKQITDYLETHPDLTDEQINNFLSAYPQDAVKAWRTGELPNVMEGTVTDVQIDKKYNELSEETKQFLKEQSERMMKIMPFCKCGKQLNLSGVCPSCPQGKEGFRSKFFCGCGYEEFFRETAAEKLKELEEVIANVISRD